MGTAAGAAAEAASPPPGFGTHASSGGSAVVPHWVADAALPHPVLAGRPAVFLLLLLGLVARVGVGPARVVKHSLLLEQCLVSSLLVLSLLLLLALQAGRRDTGRAR